MMNFEFNKKTPGRSFTPQIIDYFDEEGILRRNVIKHEKVSQFKLKMQKFRKFVFNKTGEFNINSSNIDSKKREKIRQEAKIFAGLV